jgi:hypothetical protein
MIDWRKEVYKKLHNLERAIRQDVISRGDASSLLDESTITQNADGSYTLLMFHPPNQAASKAETAAPKKKGRKKSTPPPEESVVDESVMQEE